MPDPTDLRALSNQFSLRCEQEKTQDAPDAWSLRIPCRWGHIYPQARGFVGVFVQGRRVREQLKALHKPRQWADDGQATFRVPIAELPAVLRIMKPRNRRVLSPERKAAAIARLGAWRAKQNGGS